MEGIGVLAFTMSISAMGIAVMALIYFHVRLNNLEKKLKEFDVIPKDFDSKPKEFDSL